MRSASAPLVGRVKMDSKEKTMKVNMLQIILKDQYGITTHAELMAAMRDMPGIDISIFVTAPAGKECLF